MAPAGMAVDRQQIGQYRIDGPLGEGGMGVVYRALDTRLNRPVAIKFLSDDLADAAARRRFQREAQTASSLNHPHILTVHDIGEHDDHQYIVVEFVDGGTLNDWAQQEKRSWRQIVELLTGVADGLATAHDAGILHRDVKPANILVTRSGYAKLADFGLAKLVGESDGNGTTRLAEARTGPGMVIGTVAYMSPEQASGQPLDARSDIFSFGVVLYELLGRRRPFGGRTDLETLQRVIHDAPPPLGDDIPLAVRLVVDKALAKDPAERYQSMRELVVDLRRVARSSDVALVPARQTVVSPAWVAGLAIVAAAAAGWWLWRAEYPGGSAQPEYTQLTSFPDAASSPSLSPDGRMLTFIRGAGSFITSGQVYVKMLPDGEPKPLTDDDFQKMSPVFSPDGSRIAYTIVDSQNEWDTWEVPVLGGAPRRWLPNASGLVWVDQKRVLFSEKIRNSKGNHMKVVVAEASRANARDLYVPMPIGAMAHRTSASPDGAWALIVEMDDRGDFLPCRMVPLDGTSTGRQVGPPGAACLFAAWSPDGRWMYLNSAEGGVFQIWRQRFSARGALPPPDQVTSGPTEAEGLTMSPDGRSFISAVGLRQSSVWIQDARGRAAGSADAAGSGERQVSLEGYAYLPRFTPDGRKLLYVVRKSVLPERGELWLADLDTGRNEPLLPGVLLSSHLSQPYDISPDGQRVVLETVDQDGRTRLWLAPIDRRSPPRQIPGVEGDGPAFGPEGDIFFRGREGDYGFAYRVREDGTGLRKATDHPVTQIRGLSRDGRWLVVYARADEHRAGVTLALPLGGGQPVQIFGPGLSAKWSLDGRRLFLSSGESSYSVGAGRTYIVPLAPGSAWPPIPDGGFQSEEPLADLPGVRIIDSPDVAPGPTEDVIALARATVQRNLYRVPVP